MKILTKLGWYLIILGSVMLLGGMFVPWAKTPGEFGYKEFHLSISGGVLVLGIVIVCLFADREAIRPYLYLIPVIGSALKKNDEINPQPAIKPPGAP